MLRYPFDLIIHTGDLGLRDALAPVVERHGVQLVLAGHDHDYERMKPQHGVAYVVTFGQSVIHFVVVEVAGEELVLHAIDGTGVEFDSMVVPRTPGV